MGFLSTYMRKDKTLLRPLLVVCLIVVAMTGLGMLFLHEHTTPTMAVSGVSFEFSLDQNHIEGNLRIEAPIQERTRNYSSWHGNSTAYNKEAAPPHKVVSKEKESGDMDQPEAAAQWVDRVVAQEKINAQRAGKVERFPDESQKDGRVYYDDDSAQRIDWESLPREKEDEGKSEQRLNDVAEANGIGRVVPADDEVQWEERRLIQKGSLEKEGEGGLDNPEIIRMAASDEESAIGHAPQSVQLPDKEGDDLSLMDAAADKRKSEGIRQLQLRKPSDIFLDWRRLTTESNSTWPFKEISNKFTRVCEYKTSEPILFIYVYTAPKNSMERMMIRSTWGSIRKYKGYNIIIRFFLGATDNITQQTIFREADRYKDIVQHDYIDHYKNLTLKGLGALNWVSTYCSKAQYVLKADDDTFINIFRLIPFLKARREIEHDNFICARKSLGVGPERNMASKWYVAPDEYSEAMYPPYCQGYAYFVPVKHIGHLIEQSRKVVPFQMEDVYFSGILCEAVSLRKFGPSQRGVISVEANQMSRFPYTNVAESFSDPVMSRLIFGAHIHSIDYMNTLWAIATKLSTRLS